MSALEKLLKGEVLTEEEKGSLTPEQIATARKQELDALEGIRAERRRIEQKKQEDELRAGSEFSKKYLEEQTAKAEVTAFAELSGQGIELTEEKKAKIRDTRKRLDTGSVTYDNLVDDFMAAAAAVERTQLFKDRKDKMDFEKNAADFMKGAAGSQGGSSGNGTEGGKSYPPEVWEMVKDARNQGLTLTPEEALTSLTKGMRRVHR